MKYYSCKQVEEFRLYISNAINEDFLDRYKNSGNDITMRHTIDDISEDNIRLRVCCEKIGVPPEAVYELGAEDVVDSFVKLREGIIKENMAIIYAAGSRQARKLTEVCEKCAHYRLDDWPKGDGLIHQVTLGMYPALCQCQCFYCDIQNTNMMHFDRTRHSGLYEKVFDTVEYALKRGLIAQDALWAVTSGEITVNPYKDRLLDLLRDKRTWYYTNCFIFEEKIARNLKENPGSQIYLSIDSGTPETWRKIKGFNNYGTVTDNLAKYAQSSATSGQIKLKYIVFPGINDTPEDYRGVIEIMKKLSIDQLSLSRDYRIKYELGDEQTEALIDAAARLVAMLNACGYRAVLSPYKPHERERIAELAEKLNFSVAI